VKIAKSLVLVALLFASPIWAQTPDHPAPNAAASSTAAMPPNWDPRIPLPKGAVLTSSTAPKVGVVYSADFTVTGTYDELVKFYDEEMPKSGFKLGPKVAIPARKVYNRSFSQPEILDSILIRPADDPSKFVIHIAYTPPSAKKKATAPQP
jgi:hypothetical protein